MATSVSGPVSREEAASIIEFMSNVTREMDLIEFKKQKNTRVRKLYELELQLRELEQAVEAEKQACVNLCNKIDELESRTNEFELKFSGEKLLELKREAKIAMYYRGTRAPGYG